MHRADFKAALEECDVEKARAIWREVAPHLPQPRDTKETLESIHGARTYMEDLPFWKRAYSHSWLIERGLPSGLPDHLKPRAQRLYPVIVEGVGIAVNSANKALAQELQLSMGAAVEECYADKRTEPEFVRARMNEARERVLKGD